MNKRKIKLSIFFLCFLVCFPGINTMVLAQAKGHPEVNAPDSVELILFLIILSLGVLFYWFFTCRKKGIDTLLFSLGIVLHLSIIILIIFFRWFGLLLQVSSISLSIFQVWLALKLVLGHKELGGIRFLGLIPLLIAIPLIVLFAIHLEGIPNIISYDPVSGVGVIKAFYVKSPGWRFRFLMMLPSFAMAFGMVIYYLIKKKEPAAAPAPGKAEKVQETAQPVQAMPETSVPCNSLTLTVQTKDISTLKTRGTEFSNAILNENFNLQDRIIFKGIPIVVTQIEPHGTAVVTSETKINIKKTDDQVLLNCPKCGEIQQKIQKNCSSCGAVLPVTILER